MEILPEYRNLQTRINLIKHSPKQQTRGASDPVLTERKRGFRPVREEISRSKGFSGRQGQRIVAANQEPNQNSELHTPTQGGGGAYAIATDPRSLGIGLPRSLQAAADFRGRSKTPLYLKNTPFVLSQVP
jgi:hypothetical protein